MSSESRDDLHPAFITTDRVNGERIPIDGEPIVIVLGRDEQGRPLELSISLRKDKGKEGQIYLYSIPETVLPQDAGGGFPVPSIEPTKPINVFRVSVNWKSLRS